VRAAYRLAAVASAALLAGGCSSAASRPVPTGRADESGVTVTVRLVTTSGGGRQIEATFAPDRPGFHVYSVDLPAGGVQGLGIPTRLGVQGALTAGGKPTADKPVLSLAVTGTDLVLPVYPDGPVTLTLPVGGSRSGHVDVVVSYGACSPGACLAPVTDKRIPLDFG
jgi:hypothetical protein